MEDEPICHKYGRKKLSDSKKRKHIVKLSFNQEEYETLISSYEKSNSNELAVFIRELLSSKMKNVKYSNPVNERTIVEIRRMGNNLNQISRVLNLQKGNIPVSEYTIILGQIQESLRGVITSINDL